MNLPIDIKSFNKQYIDEFFASQANICTFLDYEVEGNEEWWEDYMTRKSYTADFETTTSPKDCRVWAFAVCDIDDIDNIVYGNCIEDFIEWCRVHAQCNVYFHNLAFDGAFIMDYLLNHGWLWVEDRDDAHDKTFTTVISDANQVYCIEMFFTSFYRVKIYDSLKIIPLSIEQMASAFGLPVVKGSIDYAEEREPGHILTDEEKNYIKNDVLIDAMAMRNFLDNGMNKMTAGANALSDYRSIIGGKKGFRKWFPKLDEEVDRFIRQAYRGGYTFVNPKYAGSEVRGGIVLDKNSLYPSVMASSCGELMPYGNPVWFSGKPRVNDAYNLWIAQVTCSFRIRKDHFPCIQLKGNFRFNQREYLSRSDGDVTFTVTSVDWELMKHQYHIYNLRWHGGYVFKSSRFLFRKYVDKWVTIKNQASIDGNKGLRQIAKIELNSLYGKFATRMDVHSRKPEIIDGVLKYVDLPVVTRDPVYLPVGVFVTAWGRFRTVTAAQSLYDRFVYADTDSLHLIGLEEPGNLEIDPVKLGAWKHESTFTRGKYLGPKCYIEQEEGKDEITVHIAGLPSRCHGQVTFDNFRPGAVYDGKLYQKRVTGGIVLEEGKMQIRERK